jgi:nickel/cobalt transporter (NicO) family protein
VNDAPELLLIAAVAAVGVLHTLVPDHWVPIALIARQRSWSKRETARAALLAGTGHVFSTLLIAAAFWFAGVVVAEHFGHIVDTVSSIALILFGGWVAISAWRELRWSSGHSAGHDHGHAPIHRSAKRSIATDDGILELSIFEAGVPPRFRLIGAQADAVRVETRRANGARQVFLFANHGTHWESSEEIPEPHQFAITLIVESGGRTHSYATQFDEDEPGASGHAHDLGSTPAEDPLYAPLRGETAVLTRHLHAHRHGSRTPHLHWHDHTQDTAHAIMSALAADPPLHHHRHKTTARMALLLILGSSPMVEGIPAFFAAAKYGAALVVLMAIIFALSTIVTYVLLCVSSSAGLQNLGFGRAERYGEVLSGALIALIGLALWLWPVP